MNNQYLIPANSKRSQLIFGIFRPVDLIIFVCGTGLTILLLLVISNDSLLSAILKLLPISICGFLIFPLGNYHNVMVFIRELFLYLNNRRVYVWKGWCVTDEYSEEN